MSENEIDEKALERVAVTRAVDEILRFHNLPVNEEDYEELVKNYVRVRKSMAKLRVPEARYAVPALIFTAL